MDGFKGGRGMFGYCGSGCESFSRDSFLYSKKGEQKGKKGGKQGRGAVGKVRPDLNPPKLARQSSLYPQGWDGWRRRMSTNKAGSVVSRKTAASH